MPQRKMLIKKYLCIFCNKRINVNNSLYNNGHVGICAKCIKKLRPTPHPPLFEGVKHIDYVISPLFYEGKIRDVIIRMKFYGNKAFSDVLAFLLCNLLNDMAVLSDFDLVIPAPLSKERLFERGFNQAALLAKPFAEQFGVNYREDILLKIKDTKRQSRLPSSERFTNVRGAFSASSDAAGKKIIIVDDIFTTGSTLAECAQTLKDAGAANIVGVTLTKKQSRENIFNRMY